MDLFNRYTLETMYRSLCRYIVIFLISLFLMQSAIAAPVSPGAVVAPVDKPVYQPESKQTPAIDRPQSKPVAAPESELSVQVDRFDIVGNTTYSDSQLRELISTFEDRKLSISQIYEAADRVEVPRLSADLGLCAGAEDQFRGYPSRGYRRQARFLAHRRVTAELYPGISGESG